MQKFRNLNFNIKGNIIHLNLFFPSLVLLCYIEIYTNFSVKMRGNINKKIIERMKKRGNLDLEPKGS
jgi:hypothetical protein